MSEPRPTFDQIVQKQALAFAADLLREVPELEGVAIVPTYKIPQPNLPFGFIIGQKGPLRSPNELMHAAMQLHATLNYVMQNMFEFIKECDGAMGRLAAEIKELDAEKTRLSDERLTAAIKESGGHVDDEVKDAASS